MQPGRDVQNTARAGGLRTVFCGLMGMCILLVVSACDTFGLPAYQEPTTPRPVGSGVAGILDIDPKFARAGDQGVVLSIRGLKTGFSESTQVNFPDEPGIAVAEPVVESDELIRVTLTISPQLAPGTRQLQVVTVADGTMTYTPGFTIVE